MMFLTYMKLRSEENRYQINSFLLLHRQISIVFFITVSNAFVETGVFPCFSAHCTKERNDLSEMTFKGTFQIKPILDMRCSEMHNSLSDNMDLLMQVARVTFLIYVTETTLL